MIKYLCNKTHYAENVTYEMPLSLISLSIGSDPNITAGKLLRFICANKRCLVKAY